MLTDDIGMVNPNKYYRRFPRTGDRTRYYSKILTKLVPACSRKRYWIYELKVQSTIHEQL